MIAVPLQKSGNDETNKENWLNSIYVVTKEARIDKNDFRKRQ